MNWRTNTLLIFFVSLYGLLVFKLFTLQVEKGTWYVRLAQSREAAAGTLLPSRGNIYFTDRNHNRIPAALNKEYPVIYAVPKELAREEERGGGRVRDVAAWLTPLIGEPVEKLNERLQKKNDEYELLVAKASTEFVSEIHARAVRGIYSKMEAFRFYPFGGLAAHLLGFVSSPNETEKNKMGSAPIGRYGAEQRFDEILRGTPGDAARGRPAPPRDGENIFLTIDRVIQAEGEEILKQLVSAHHATGGTFIVEDPSTGRILAMGSEPSFDPNIFATSSVKNFLNPAIQAVYEPGSIFKVITMAAGMDSGKLTPTTAYVDKGYVVVGGRRIENWDFEKRGAYGHATMTDVIENSINTGAIFAEKKIGHDLFYDYLMRFGLSDLTGIVLPGEVRGNLKNLERGREVDFATASYGHGVSITPLALVNAVSAIANGGVLMQPILVSEEEPRAIRRVIKEESARTIAAMMTSSVLKNKVAAIPGYSIAGKTGTALVPNFNTGGYTDEVINTFIGFAPSSNPRFVILIKLDRPAGSPLAGQTVVPAFREFAQFLLNYLDIPPDEVKSP